MILKICLFLLLILGICLIYYFKPRYVNLKLVSAINDTNININSSSTEFNEEYHWWFIDSEHEINPNVLEMSVSPKNDKDIFINYPENIMSWGIDFETLEIDFEKNNVILSFSREIKEMKFKRVD